MTLSGSGICDAVSVFTILNRCICANRRLRRWRPQLRPARESWVDEHMNYRYDCVSDFWMEKVCGNIDDCRL